jgi:hypothetical protein
VFAARAVGDMFANNRWPAVVFQTLRQWHFWGASSNDPRVQREKWGDSVSPSGCGCARYRVPQDVVPVRNAAARRRLKPTKP